MYQNEDPVLQAEEEDPFRAYHRVVTIPARQSVPRPAPNIPGRLSQQEIQAMELQKAEQEAREEEAQRVDDELHRLGQASVSPEAAMELENLHLKRPARNSSRASNKKKKEDNKPTATDQPQAMDTPQGQTKRAPSEGIPRSRSRQKKQQEEEEDEAAALDKIHINPKELASMMDLHQGQTKRQQSGPRSVSRDTKKRNEEQVEEDGSGVR
jgi:hypothetical protein